MPIKDSWSRIKKAWSVFRGKESSDVEYSSSVGSVGFGSSGNPAMRSTFPFKERTLISAVQNRIAVDSAQIQLVQCKVDEDGRYAETVTSGLNNVLEWDANIDQSGFEFKLDIFNSLLSDGIIALVPYRVDPDLNHDEYDIKEMRVGTIVRWYPKKVCVSIYNDDTGRREEIIIPKSKVAIVKNPFYSLMNERNSLVQMLASKYRLLDMIDQRLGSTKLDLIIQLPYPFKGPTREEQAKNRQNEITRQLTNTEYGIAYIDGSEKIIQLNRPVENNLLEQIEYMEKSLYNQLSMTPEILNGTATPEAMLNYFNRTVEPCVTVVIDEMSRKFVRGKDEEGNPIHPDEKIMMFRSQFKLVPAEKIADIVDKFTRNEVATANEMRAIIGWKPSQDPKADELRNATLNHPEEGMDPYGLSVEQYPDEQSPDTY